MSIVDGNPVNASYTNGRVMSKQADNAIQGYIQSQKFLASMENDIATSATINALTSNAGFVRLTGATATALNGIADGIDGRIMMILNVSTANVTASHQSSSATAANRIISPSALGITILPNRSLLLQYDAAQSRWIVVGGTALSGNTSSTSSSSILNNTTANVSGLLFAATTQFSSLIPYNVLRGTSMEVGQLVVWYNGSTWSIEKAWSVGNAAIDFGISAGQVTYTSDNSNAGTMQWSFSTMGS
jgi:hypothetical protein